jgi:molybdopterin converting factor small subunit
MSKKTVQIRLFGAFRNYSNESEIAVEIDSASSLMDIKAGLLRKLAVHGKEDAIRALLGQSAVANETRVLTESELVLPGMKLAILPPVCGG